MRALLADLSARSRSILGRMLGRTADLCIALTATLLAWRERVDPLPVDLTPEHAGRILIGVMTQIEADAAPSAVDPQPFAEPFTVPPGTALCKWQGFH